MWRLVSVLCVLTLLAAFPVSVSAQGGSPIETTETSQTDAALNLELDSDGLEVSPLAASVAEARVHSEMERGVRGARLGVGISTVPLVLGAVIAMAGGAVSVNRNLSTPSDTSSGYGAVWVGTALVGVGGVSMIASGILLGVRKRKLRNYEAEHSLSSHRIQWDSHTSRFVF
jgi:hypothetical protein